MSRQVLQSGLDGASYTDEAVSSCFHTASLMPPNASQDVVLVEKFIFRFTVTAPIKH